MKPFGATQWKRLLALRLPLCGLVLGLLATAHAAGGMITFDAPGAGTSSGQGTFGLSINTAGAITGYYLDAGNVYHGFLRAPDGTITTFDAPGAGSGSGLGTSGLSINAAGAITGYYWDASNVSHGFLRAPDGTITTFDPPGAGGGTARGTISRNINTAGAITGSYQDTSFVNHGFLRAPDGTITTFDAPAGTSSGQIVAFAINDEGAISGYYWSNVGTFDAHGFLRAPDGTITTFDAPGAGTINTTGLSINTAGAITGNYQDVSGAIHGFLRAPDGTITTFDAPGGGTTPLSINTAGAITGPGFLRAPDGTITSTGTINRSINAAGAITGYYTDANGIHGFVSNPADLTPPITTAVPSPGPNSYGWNNTNVTLNLNATDNPGGSGIKQIQFALSGAQNTGLQTVAGNVASVTISAEGITVLSYFATDNVGNQETAKTLTVRIDKTPPVISGLPAPGCTIWPPNHKLVQVAAVTAADALSGLAPGSFKVTGTGNDSNGQIVITGGPSQFLVQLGADKDQVYTLTATATDLAGNTITQQATCTIPHDQGN